MESTDFLPKMIFYKPSMFFCEVHDAHVTYTM